MFDWDRFKNGEIAVHCDTEEKANDFLKECERRDIIWTGGDKATHHNNYSVNYGETCYFCRSKKITYCDRKHFNKKGIEIIKWEIKSMKELTFKEVIANIKEGEVWVNEIAPISFIRLREGGVLDFNENEGINLSVTYKLQRKEYTFQEAFRAYEEGKEIESCEGCKFKRCDKDIVLIIDFAGDKIKRDSCEELFSIKEIRGKWYIND